MSTDPKPAPRALGCFFLPFLGLGLFFLVMLVQETVRSMATYTWPAADCRITVSEVVPTDNPYSPYRAQLRYTYERQGRSFESDTSQTLDSYSAAWRYVRRRPVGWRGTCYVDPVYPGRALLEHKSLALALFLPLPLLFVLVGVVGLVAVVWRIAPQGISRPISRARAGRRAGGIILTVVGTLGSLLYVSPLWRAAASRSWPVYPCTILKSDVQPHRGSKGSTGYAPAILYSYLVNGVEHRSDTYHLMSGSPGRRSAAEAIAERYPRGSAATCAVNPKDADDAILSLDWPPVLWTGLLPVGLLLAGVSIWRAGPRQVLPKAERALVPPRLGRLPKFVMAAALNLVFLWIALPIEWRTLPAPLAGLGALIGVSLLAALFYRALALLDPKATLRLDAWRLKPGARASCRWELSGHTANVRNLRITLTGAEEATAQRGKETQKQRYVFYTQVLAETERARDMECGSVPFTIPAGAMHSFEAEHNRIVWELRLEADVAHLPDLDERFKLVVEP